MRGTLPSHAEAGGAPEEPAQHRPGVQLRRVQQDVSQPDEHCPPQTDPHGVESVRLRSLRVQHQSEVQSGVPSSAAREGLQLQVRDVRQGLLPQDRVPGASERAHEQESVPLRALLQALPVQEEPVGAPDDAPRRQAGRRGREEREDQARVQVLPGEIRVQEAAGAAHEEPARIRGRAGEAPVRPVRRGALLDETADRAQAQPRGREDLRVRRLRQAVRQQGEPEHPQADAHGRQAARLPAVRPRLHTADLPGPALALPHGSAALPVSGLRQGLRVQHPAQEASQGAREGRAAEAVSWDLWCTPITI